MIGHGRAVTLRKDEVKVVVRSEPGYANFWTPEIVFTSWVTEDRWRFAAYPSRVRRLRDALDAHGWEVVEEACPRGLIAALRRWPFRTLVPLVPFVGAVIVLSLALLT